MADSGPGRKARASLLGNQDRALVAKHIRAEMAKRGLTQAKLAEIAAYDERTIRNVLKGLPVKDLTLYEISASLQIDLSRLPLSEPFGSADHKPSPESHGPAVAVLPFVNISDDARQDYFVDGMVEDIITELSRFSELIVIARNSTFQYKRKAVDVRQVARDLGAQYVVEGSVRRSKQRLRITAQLINATSGAHLWAERYDREISDVFSVQDEVARAIASVLVAHVSKAEAARILTKPPETWEAYDCYLRAADLFSSFPGSSNVDRIYEARRLLERALSLDETYARAHAMLSATHMATWVGPLDSDLLNPAALERAYRAAQRAVQLDPNLAQARGQLGYVLLYRREHDAAVAEFERACALNPNFSDWRYATTMNFAGQPMRAIDILTSLTLRDPFYPVNALVVLGLACFMAKRYSETLAPLCEAAIRAPDFRQARVCLAASYARLGQLEDAGIQVAHIRRLDPAYTISRSTKLIAPFKHVHDAEHWAESLRAAGVPE
jgi:adenylate cyclase